jgi:hypothetical protein
MLATSSFLEGEIEDELIRRGSKTGLIPISHPPKQAISCNRK